ncbi:SGNH/GDSL hydrolase family protein [Microbispora amethystogenes]|uniref:Lipase n=1 Tax=Microbispora amethystogenes TaxID=1427754 RepID=A0ABQ4FNR8_9ACTN|nr:SGNH/GDSL hydrolase family protein [Microbispora amethystogenes]GIH36444.1 lipase [Microbispora amethystogenes]
MALTPRSVRRTTATAALLAASVSPLLPGTGAAASTASTASAAGSAVTARYVALGDSYASGAGLPEPTDPACSRSGLNYPSVLARSYGSRSFKDVTCGGATTRDLWHRQGAKAPQLRALSRNTTLVTVTMGGNDIGFSSIIGTCLSAARSDPAGSPCQAQYAKSGHDELARRIRALSPRITAMLADVRRRSPRATVMLVGYPALLPESGAACPSVVPFAKGDFPYLRDTVKRLNGMLRQQARRSGALYVDTYTPTIGHDMCAGDARFVEPLVVPAGVAPAHPNQQGQRVMASLVAERIDRLRR